MTVQITSPLPEKTFHVHETHILNRKGVPLPILSPILMAPLHVTERPGPLAVNHRPSMEDADRVTLDLQVTPGNL